MKNAWAHCHEPVLREHVAPAELEMFHGNQLLKDRVNSIDILDRCEYRPTSSEIDRILYQSRLLSSSPGGRHSSYKSKLVLHVDENHRASIRYSDFDNLEPPMQDDTWSHPNLFRKQALSESEWQVHDDLLNLNTSPTPQDTQITTNDTNMQCSQFQSSTGPLYGLGIRGLIPTNLIPSSPPPKLDNSDKLVISSRIPFEESQETTINWRSDLENLPLFENSGTIDVENASLSAPSSPSINAINLAEENERPYSAHSEPTLQDSDDAKDITFPAEKVYEEPSSVQLNTVEEYRSFMIQEINDKKMNSPKLTKMEPVERNVNSQLFQEGFSFLKALCALETKHEINCSRGVYQCNCSKKKFHNLHLLASHLDNKHDPSIRPFVCPDETCAWSVIGFNCRPECKRHILSVHLEQHKVCTLCKMQGKFRKFARSDALQRHIKQFHLSNTLKATMLPNVRTVLRKPSKRSTREKKQEKEKQAMK